MNNQTRLGFALFILLTVLLSCTEKEDDDAGLTVSVSILPQKYIVQRIASDEVDVNVLIPPGASPAVYELKPSQMKDLAKSALYLRIGHVPFEKASMDRIKAANKDMKVVDLSEDLELIEHEGEHGHEGHGHEAVDPHVWMSVKEMRVLALNTLMALESVNPQKAEQYKNNYVSFIGELDIIDKNIKSKLSGHEGKAFMIYHPVLSYFARDYGLKQIAFEVDGKKPSVKAIKGFVDIAKAQGIKTIFVQKEFDKSSAEILAQESGAEVVEIDPLSPQWKESMLSIADALARSFE